MVLSPIFSILYTSLMLNGDSRNLILYNLQILFKVVFLSIISWTPRDRVRRVLVTDKICAFIELSDLLSLFADFSFNLKPWIQGL